MTGEDAWKVWWPMITQDHPLIDFRMSVLAAERTHLVTEIISIIPRICNLHQLWAELFLFKAPINSFMLNKIELYWSVLPMYCRKTPQAIIKRSTNNFIPKPGLGIKLFPCICLTNDLNLVLFLQQFVIILDPQAAIKLVCMRDLEQAGRVLLKHIYHASSLQLITN